MPYLYAHQHVKKMRGGAQSHLMRASDKGFYVTKFTNNPQHIRVLANEMLASRLGQWLGLPVPQTEVIEVSDWLIDHTADLRIEVAGHSLKCAKSRHLGSRYACDPLEDFLFEYLPESMFPRVRNGKDFARVLVLDKWLGNADGRQVVFTKTAKAKKYTATFIDHGYCFNAGEWSFPDLALHGVYYRNYAYAHVQGWDAFEPVLSRAETVDLLDLWRCADPIPPEWYENDVDALQQLVETLYERRKKIRDLITAFRNSSRNPFPNWQESVAIFMPASLPQMAVQQL